MRRYVIYVSAVFILLMAFTSPWAQNIFRVSEDDGPQVHIQTGSPETGAPETVARTPLVRVTLPLPHCAAHTATNMVVEVDPATQCCRHVPNDIDHGYSLYRLLSLLLCGPQNAELPPLRVLQIGANSGDNENDHLFKILTGQNNARHIRACLVEPVPWLFDRLRSAYLAQSNVVLVRGAVADYRGVTTFVAPREGTRGWRAQMGGLKLPPRTQKNLVKTRGLGSFQKITVNVTTTMGLLRDQGWGDTGADVIVVDTEGGDFTIIADLIASVPPTSLPSVLQYEWKHMTEALQANLTDSLRGRGYCVVNVHYDTLAWRKSATSFQGACNAWYNI